MITDQDLIEYDAAISKVIRVADYQKLKSVLHSIDIQLESLTIDSNFVPKNPRQEACMVHNKVKKQALEKQRERLITKMGLLEEIIKKDMQSEAMLHITHTPK